MKTSKTVKAAVLIAAAVFTAGSPLAMFSGAFSAPSIIAYADDYQKDGLTFELFDDHAEVSGSDYTATSADIPASVEGLPVTAIKDYAFNGSAIESVKIPDSVKTIGNWTFSMCTNLKAVTLPDSIEYIGIKAFELCSSLSEVEFPDHLVEISNHVFADTPWLKAQQEKNDLVIINGALIDADKSKGDVVIPSDVKYISAGAFQRNENITSVVVPSGVPVAKITPLPPVFSSRYLHLRKRSSAFCEAELEIPATFCNFVATNRFLNSWASSMNRRSIPSCSKVSVSS